MAFLLLITFLDFRYSSGFFTARLAMGAAARSFAARSPPFRRSPPHP